MKKQKLFYAIGLLTATLGISMPINVSAASQAEEKATAAVQAEEKAAAAVQFEDEEMNDPQYFRYMDSYMRKESGPSDASGLSHAERFEDYEKLYGIDVSKWQGNIDWTRVKDDGISFSMIRLGYRDSKGGTLQLDSYYDANVNGASAADISIGIYFFSQAISVEEAAEEAQFVIDNLARHSDKIELPVVIDMEKLANSRLDAANLSPSQKAEICEAFCRKVQSAGYAAGIYSNKTYLRDQIDMSSLENKYFVWMANYGNSTDYAGQYSMWQYSSSGSVDGIDGNVDLDVLYRKPGNGQEMYFSGLHLLDNGEWALFQNGEIATAYTGLYYDRSIGWWFVVNGKIDFGYNDLWCDPVYGWWKVAGGTIDFGYTGLYHSQACGWWLIGGGSICFDYNDLWYDPVYGWWKVNGGTVDFGYTGLYHSQTLGWWLIGGGTICFDYNELWNDPVYGWWKVTGGTIDFDYTGLYQSREYGWWLIGGGAVCFDYNDLWLDPVYGWWKISGGTIDFGYTGLYCSQALGWWLIGGGTICFDYNGLWQDPIYGPWNIVGGTIDFTYLP